MVAISTSDDHPLNENEGAAVAVHDSSAMQQQHHQQQHRQHQQQQQQQQHQQQTQQNGDGNQSPALLIENERLRGELIELRWQIRRMEDIQKQQQQQFRVNHTTNKEGNTDSGTRHARRQQDRSTTKPNTPAVLLELPVTLRPSSVYNNTINNSTGNNKDHQSVSTADDRETLEPPFDIESHQSAAGLHHRSPVTVEKILTTTTQSTISTHKTRRMELMTDEECSSSIKGCHDEDGLQHEAQGLIASDSFSPRNCNPNRQNDGIMLERAAAVIESTTSGDESDPNYHQMPFWQTLSDRASWLIGLLVFQSMSSFILAQNESLLQHHTVIVQFLTMLVGAGGNAGNQASVGVVRGIAVGSVTRSNAKRVLVREFAMGVALSFLLGLAGFIRAKVFSVPWLETIAITTSLFMIVIISVIVGASLPMGMQAVGIDPAHSSTTVQVIMDITGVVITVHISRLMLDSGFVGKLSFDGEMR